MLSRTKSKNYLYIDVVFIVACASMYNIAITLCNERESKKMKLSEMLEIQDNRQNSLGFLHFSEQIVLQNLLNVEHIDKHCFVDCCNIVLSMYKDKVISNKIASKCFEILSQANINFKTERYRYDSAYKTLYKYSKEHDSYLFYLVDCSMQTYNTIIKRDGKYID